MMIKKKLDNGREGDVLTIRKSTFLSVFTLLLCGSLEIHFCTRRYQCVGTDIPLPSQGHASSPMQESSRNNLLDSVSLL